MSNHRMSSSTPDLERMARKRVGARIGWCIHLLVYLLVNVLLWVVLRHDGGVRHGPALPLWGWGLGLVIHGVVVLCMPLRHGWRERWVRNEVERLQKARG